MAKLEQNNNQGQDNNRGRQEPTIIGGFDDPTQRRKFRAARGDLRKEIQGIIAQIKNEGPTPQKPKQGEFDFPV